jgi:hypothetical protein
MHLHCYADRRNSSLPDREENMLAVASDALREARPSV